jgi:hypothetical protein
MAIVALESDSAQAAALRHVICDLVGTQLTVVDSIDRLLEAVRTQKPDVILLPPLISPVEEANLFEFLKTLPENSVIQTLITPNLRTKSGESSPDRRWLRWGNRRQAEVASVPIEFHLFAERLAWALETARERREYLAEQLLLRDSYLADPTAVVAAMSGEAVSESTELLVLTPPSSLVELLAAVDESSPAFTDSQHLNEATSRLMRKLADEDRRVHRRFKASELMGIRSARIKFGPHVTLLDVSAGGVLLESDALLHPESEATLELVANRGNVVVPFRVLRCQIAEFAGQPRYQGACAFARPLDLGDLVGADSAETREDAFLSNALMPVGAGVLASQKLAVRNAW